MVEALSSEALYVVEVLFMEVWQVVVVVLLHRLLLLVVRRRMVVVTLRAADMVVELLSRPLLLVVRLLQPLSDGVLRSVGRA